MRDILDFILVFLVIGAYVYGAYLLGKFLFSRALKQKKVFNIIWIVLFLFVFIIMILFPLYYGFKDTVQFAPIAIEKPSYNIEELEKLRKLREDELRKSSILDKLVKGKIAYEVPDTMNVGKNYKATVIITKAMNYSILFQDIYQGNFQIEEIKVSSVVKVDLIDPTENNFKVTSLNSVEQLVDENMNTVWKWNITPIRGGDNELILRVTVKVLDRLGEAYKDIRVFEKTIKVNVTFIESIKIFIVDYWKYLVPITTVIVIPLVIWGYKKLSNRRKKNAEQKHEQLRKRKKFEEMIMQR